MMDRLSDLMDGRRENEAKIQEAQYNIRSIDADIKELLIENKKFGLLTVNWAALRRMIHHQK